MNNQIKHLGIVVGGTLGGVALLVAIAVGANKASEQSPTQAQHEREMAELRVKREAQYQKCVNELWPAVHANNPYDGKGADPLTGKSWQDQHMREVMEQVAQLCAARELK